MISLVLIWEQEPFEFCTVKVTGFSVRKSDGLPFVEIDSNFQSWRTCVRGLALNKKTHLYSHKRGKKTEESPFAAKERVSQSNRTENHSEVWNSKLWNATGVPSGQQGFKQFFQNQFGHLNAAGKSSPKKNKFWTLLLWSLLSYKMACMFLIFSAMTEAYVLLSSTLIKFLILRLTRSCVSC